MSNPWVIKAEYLLGLRAQTDGSIFDSTRGMLTWIAAGRYGGYLSAPSLPHPSEVDLTGEIAFNSLVATVSREMRIVHGSCLPLIGRFVPKCRIGTKQQQLFQGDLDSHVLE